MHTKIFAIDFFCGTGGLTQGLLKSGIDVLFGIDIDGTAKDTYEYNNGVPFIKMDLHDLSAPKLQKLIEHHLKSRRKTKKDKILFAGCAPCQPFSKLKRTKDTDSEKETLLIKFASLITKCEPDLVFSENVPQIVKNRVIFDRFRKMLGSKGYMSAHSCVDFVNYGVPQTRKRMVYLGSKSFQPEIERPNWKSRTVRSELKGLLPLEAGGVDPNDSNHVAANLSDLNIKRLKSTPKDGGDCRSWPKDLLPNCRIDEGYYDVYGRLHWDQPSPTLTTKCNSLSNGRYGHPEQDRALTLREAALLQTYPRRYKFFGQNTNIAKHIGNSVPPRGAKYFGKYLLKKVSM